MIVTILRTAFLAYVRLLLRRGRRWAAIAAILLEALWAAVAAEVGYKTFKDWPIDWEILWVVTVGATLFLVAAAGLLLRPVRAYAGLVRGSPASGGR